MHIFSEKIFKISLLVIFLLEILSFVSFLYSWGNAVFLFLVFLFFVLSLYNLEYAVLFLLGEVFIGSKGYLFFYDYQGTLLSIRIAFWLIVMAVFLTKILLSFSLKGKVVLFVRNLMKDFWVLGVLLIFVVWGVVNAILNHQKFNNIFFDVNAWLFFALIFPLYWLFYFKNHKERKKFLNNIFSVLFASAVWISAETLFLFFIFTHNIDGLNSALYRWIRVSGVGEITMMSNNLYRIFFQSHIFVLFSLIFLLLFVISRVQANKQILKNKYYYIYFFLLFSFAATIIISLSRSNWVGLFAGCVLIIFYFSRRYKLKGFINSIVVILLTFFMGICLSIIVAKFPFPKANTATQITNTLTKRVSQVSGEAGISSRWSLLPNLWQKIKNSPILGSGFGATVTYKSSDPKILEHSCDGMYTTYAFEWGWLDIWLKLGFGGLLSYLIFIGYLVFDEFKKMFYGQELTLIKISFAVFLIIISVIHFFSPYLNHPLGITFLLLSLFFLKRISTYPNRITI